MAVAYVADSEFSVSEATFADENTFNWPEALAAAAADAVAVIAIAIRESTTVSTFPTATISVGGVAAAVYQYEYNAVGFGSGRSHLILALVPLAAAANDDLVIDWDPLSLELTMVVQGAVFTGVDVDALASAVAITAAGETTLGPQAVVNGDALVVAGAFYTGGDFSAAFQGSDTTAYSMLAGLPGFNPTYYSGHEIGFGYRLFSADTSETVTSLNALDYLPGIAFILPAPAVATDAFNCSCEDTTNNRTLGELRSEIITRLGFVEQKAVVAGKTLAQLKTYLMTRLGFAAQLASPPPGMPELLIELVNEAQDMLWRTYAYDTQGGSAPTALADDGDALTLDSLAVQLLALANAKSHYGQDSKPLYEQFDAYLKGLLQRSPINLAANITSILQDAQRQLYRRYAALRTERFYRWTMVVGERFYDLPDNEDDCGKKLDAYKITWVGVEDLNGTWYELAEGISPTLYTSVNRPGLPSRYEVRQCIEVFSAPDQAYTLRVKGHFGLEAFAADGDKTTIDDQAVFLLALAQAKAHYQQPDAQNYFSQASNHLGALVAGAHLTARYVPRSEQRASVPQPRMVSWDNE